jgi:hypothetical protein
MVDRGGLGVGADELLVCPAFPVVLRSGRWSAWSCPGLLGGQVQGDPAGGEGDPGGDVDEFAPDRGGGGFGQRSAISPCLMKCNVSQSNSAVVN